LLWDVYSLEGGMKLVAEEERIKAMMEEVSGFYSSLLHGLLVASDVTECTHQTA
jgi:hypothetical protein